MEWKSEVKKLAGMQREGLEEASEAKIARKEAKLKLRQAIAEKNALENDIEGMKQKLKVANLKIKQLKSGKKAAVAAHRAEKKSDKE